MSHLFKLGALMRYIRIITNNAGLKIVFEYDKEQPRTSGKTMYLPHPTTDWSEEKIALFEYYVLHECCHHIARGGALLRSLLAAKPSKTLALVCNVLADHTDERLVAQQYPGDKRVFLKGTQISINTLINPDRDFSQMELGYKKLFTLMCVDSFARLHWQPEIEPMCRHLMEVTHKDDDISKATDLLIRFVPKIKSVEEVDEVWALAREIHAVLFPDQPEEGQGEEGEQSEDGQQEGEAAEQAAKELGASEHGDGETSPRGGEGDGDEESEGEGSGKLDPKEGKPGSSRRIPKTVATPGMYIPMGVRYTTAKRRGR